MKYHIDSNLQSEILIWQKTQLSRQIEKNRSKSQETKSNFSLITIIIRTIVVTSTTKFVTIMCDPNCNHNKSLLTISVNPTNFTLSNVNSVNKYYQQEIEMVATHTAASWSALRV